MTRIDYIFSYWIFFWYILYAFKFTRYNPKFAIICGVIENIIIFGLMLRYGTKKKLMILFLIMTFLLKIIPLYSMQKIAIQKQDIVATFTLFIFYLAWISYHKKTYKDFEKQTRELIFDNKNTLPGMMFLENLNYYQ
jgi:hypothetical protein